MTETTYERLRKQVAKDAGLPSSAALTFTGETLEVCAEQAVDYARERRGEAGVRDVLKGFAAADAVESADEIRQRVSRDLGLPPDLRAKLSSGTRTEDEVVRDALDLLHQEQGEAAAIAGRRRLETMAVSGLIREQRAGTEVLFDANDMNAAIRAAAGRDV